MIRAENEGHMIRLIIETNEAFMGRQTRLEEAQLLGGTVSSESDFVRRIQRAGGPARGLFQIEPDTCLDVYNNVLTNPDYAVYYTRLMRICFGLGSAPFFVPSKEDVEALLTDCDDFSTIIGRLCYLRWPDPIPADLQGQAQYYKDFFNTGAGLGTPERYIEHWEDNRCEERINRAYQLYTYRGEPF